MVRRGGIGGMSGPTFTGGGQKSGSIPWKQVVPAPDQIIQHRVPAPERESLINSGWKNQ